MNLIIPRLKKAFPFLHTRSGTEKDFHEYCYEKDIEVVYTSNISRGVYVRFEGRDYIFLNNKLRGYLLRYVMFHELAHAIFHVPSQSNTAVEFFGLDCLNNRKRKNHREAESVAALLILPTLEMHEALSDPEFAASDELNILFEFRLKYYKRHKE